jgi:hypothetical protein
MRLDWRSALGLALSALLLWWTLKDVSAATVLGALRASDWRLWLASTVAATLIFPLRAIRWRIILAPVAARVPYGPLWRSTAIGMMVNNVAPARAGEVARAYALVREEPRVGFAAAVASLAVDRVFDAIVLLLLLFVAPLDPSFPRDVQLWGRSLPALAEGLVALTLGLLLVLYLMVAFPERLVRLFGAVLRRVAPRLEARGSVALAAFVEGLGVLRHPGRFAAVFGWTLAHWLLCAWSVQLGFQAVGITAPFTAALFLNSLLSVASAIPASPGFFGLFESVSRVGLGVYGVGSGLAVSWALGYHILTFIPITVFGLVYLARLGLGLGAIQRVPADASAPVPGDGDPASGAATPRGASPVRERSA